MSEFTTHPGIQFEQEAFEPMPAPSKSVRRERPPLITPQTSGLEEMIIELEHKIVDVDPYDFPDAYMQRRNQIIDDVEDKLVWNMAYVKQHVGSKLAHFLVDKRGMHPDKATQL